MIDHWRALGADLAVPVVLDALDSIGLKHQAPRLHLSPRTTEQAVVGRAKCLLWADFAFDDAQTYALELQAIDSVAKDDFIVCATSNSARSGIWGELLTTGAMARGAAAMLTDGGVRDLRQIRTMGFPVFAQFVSPYDSFGRQKVIHFDVPIEIDGVAITPGDIVVADADGVAIVPLAVADEVLGRASEKVRKENGFRDAVRAGASLVEAYRRFNVL